MDSALRPRDIQARIRAGASVEEVAEAAGLPVERIEVFGAPVIAERDYISGLARTNPVRRRGETTSHRSLRNAVADALVARGMNEDAVTWDAWKVADRRWQVQASFTQGGEHRRGLFVFDATGRFSVAADDEGSRLIGDLDDQPEEALALVHATQDAATQDGGLDDPPAAQADEPARTEPAASAAPACAIVEAVPAADDGDDMGDAFQEGDLEEVDGVYDIVASREGDGDVLFDMLSSFDEDSVKIYAGLVHPKEAPSPAGIVVAEPDDELVAPARSAADDPEPGDEPSVGTRGAPDPPRPDPAPAEAAQTSLIEGDIAEPAPKPRPRRKRASVPSWDEIMFGGPRADA